MNFNLSPKKKRKKIFYSFHAFNPFLEELYQNPVQFFFVIPRGVPLTYSKASQYYVKRKKCKVNDVISLSDCEASTINLDNKIVKIDIFTGATRVRLKNIFTAISRYPTRQHEINVCISLKNYILCKNNTKGCQIINDISPCRFLF